MANEALEALRKRYETAFREHVELGGELPLERAYEIGRQAAVDGLSIPDLCQVHHEAMTAAMAARTAPEERARTVAAGAVFLSEILVPFEMELRGYRESVEKLQRLNQELEERVLARTRELERSNRDLEQFASVASHDLQEPLRKIRAYAQLLIQEYQGRLDSTADKYLASVADGTERLQQLILGLLTYARVGRGKPVLKPTPLGPVVQQALANLDVALKESAADVRVDPLPTVSAAADLLEQLFQNLVGNALKFRMDRPVRVEVGAKPHEEGWLLWVRDNGIGIEPRNRERLFEIFRRLHPQAKYPGSGVGLALCKRIVELHGGRIWVESEPGQGSVFYFTLPAPPG